MTRSRSNRSGFEQRLLRTLRAMDLRDGTRVTLGFSGGFDSLALAAASAQVARSLGIELKLVHVDHGLRRTSSDDANACREQAVELQLPIEVVTIERGLEEQSSGLGLEEVARRARYQALANAATAWDSRHLMLGHQAYDQAETMLMHLFRGSGIDGVAGMRPSIERRIPWWAPADSPSVELTILRPLLAESRDSIESYLRACGLEPIADETNQSVDFDRNWVRHEILPHILARWPGAIDAMQRSAFVIDRDRQFLDEGGTATLQRALNDDRTLSTDTLVRVDPVFATRAIRQWLRVIGLGEIDQDVVARVHELARDGDKTRVVEVGDGIEVVRDGTKLTTLAEFVALVSSTIPMDPGDAFSARSNWTVEVTDPTASDSIPLLIPNDCRTMVRKLELGDRWHGSNRRVADDLRALGIHPLVRWYLLAVCSEDGVLMIPAIYPTMYTMQSDASVRNVGVRWSKQS